MPTPRADLSAALEAAFPELSTGERDTLEPFFTYSEVVAGTRIATEGERERDFFVIAKGEGKLLHGDAEIGRVAAGDRVFELGFVATLPRPASLVATTTLGLGRLTVERFRLVSETHPEVAAALSRALVVGLSRHAPPLPREPPRLVPERSLPRPSEIAVEVLGRSRRVAVGTLLRELLPERLEGRLVTCAVIDHKAVSLTTPVTAPVKIAALTTAHWEGQRVHRHSLGLAVLEALRRIEPRVQARMGPSIGFAQRIAVARVGGKELRVLAERVEQNLRALVRERAPLREEWWTVDEAGEHFAREDEAIAALLATWREPAVKLVSYGEAYALELGPLLPHTGLLEGFGVLADEDVLLLTYGSESSARPFASTSFPAVPEVPLPPHAGSSGTAPVAEEAEAAYLERHARRASAHAAALTEAHERWLGALGVNSVGAFNAACVSGEVSQLVRVSEGFHEKRISAIADEIRERLPDVRVICIAGPSSSGKTTFIQRLEVQLVVDGMRPARVSLDDYYVDRALTPRDATGELDYEAFEALRTDLLSEHLRRLLAGDEVTTARYDFVTGKSHPDGGRSLRLGPREVLLVEGIHGLNPRLLATLPPRNVFRVFVCPLAQLPFDSLSRVHASDVRLVRRVVRDRHGRGANAAESILRWPSVRAGERRHIFPFQHHADAVFDASLIYELGVLKVYAERYLLEVPRNHPAYTTAFRLIRLLDRFVAIYPDHVPPTSILREFIGESGFEA
jgi:uridine kinase